MTTPVIRVRIELRGIKPKIWRRVEVLATTTLAELHDVIQSAMGWYDSHLHEFRVKNRTYGTIMPDVDVYFEEEKHDERDLRLDALVDREIRRILYVYDFGDNWRHDLYIGKVRSGDPKIDYPVLVDGAGCCPPEDVGGVWGYGGFLQVMSDPTHEEHEDMVKWYGRPFDPTYVRDPGPL